MMKVPGRLLLPGGRKVPVRVHEIEEHLGLYSDQGIELNEQLKGIEIVAILIHELMHAVEDDMKRIGALKKQANVPHDYIEGFSYAAAIALGEAGFLKGVSKGAAIRFANDSGDIPDWKSLKRR